MRGKAGGRAGRQAGRQLTFYSRDSHGTQLIPWALLRAWFSTRFDKFVRVPGAVEQIVVFPEMSLVRYDPEQIRDGSQAIMDAAEARLQQAAGDWDTVARHSALGSPRPVPRPLEALPSLARGRRRCSRFSRTSSSSHALPMATVQNKIRLSTQTQVSQAKCACAQNTWNDASRLFAFVLFCVEGS